MSVNQALDMKDGRGLRWGRGEEAVSRVWAGGDVERQVADMLGLCEAFYGHSRVPTSDWGNRTWGAETVGREARGGGAASQVGE